MSNCFALINQAKAWMCVPQDMSCLFRMCQDIVSPAQGRTCKISYPTLPALLALIRCQVLTWDVITCSGVHRSSAAQQAGLPAHQRVAVALAPYEVCYWRGHDTQRPRCSFQPGKTTPSYTCRTSENEIFSL